MEPASSPTASPPPRPIVWILLLIPCLLWIGFVAGMMIGGIFFVPAGSGLAGPAIAFGYGAMGALAGSVLAGLLAWKLPARPLRFAALTALLLSVLVLVFVASGVVAKTVRRHAQADYYGGSSSCPSGRPC
jgi:hypothetical protein